MNRLSDTGHQAAQDTKPRNTRSGEAEQMNETGLQRRPLPDGGECPGFSGKEAPRQSLALTLRSGDSWESIETEYFEYKE